MGITAETVYCAKCANCMNNKLRLGMDAPGGCRWPCETCYGDRLYKINDMVLEKMEAIRTAINVLRDRFDKTFLGNSRGFVEDQMRRARILRGLNRMLSEILDEKDTEKVKAIKKMYDEEYFSDIRKGETK